MGARRKTDPGWLGGRLRELRQAAGWTQQRLAEEADVPVSAVQDLEQGRYPPSWATACLLADALGISLGPLGEEPEQGERPGPGRPAKATATR